MSTLRSSSLEPEPLIPMARVSRTAAAKSQRHGSGDSGATVRSDSDTVDLYLSINSLRSIQAQEEGNRRSFKELCMSGELKKCFCIESSEDESRVCMLQTWIGHSGYFWSTFLAALFLARPEITQS